MSIYYTEVRQGRGTTILAAVNGFPLARRSTMQFDTISSSGDHFLMPGENTLSLSIFENIEAHLGVAKVLTGRFDSEVPLCMVVFQEDLPPESLLNLVYPVRLEKRFVVPDDHPRPIFQDASPVDVPVEGTPEMMAPLAALHGALQAGDAEGVYGALELKSAELYRFHRAEATSPAALRQATAERVRGPYDMTPLESRDLVFEPAANRRAVTVRRRAGGPVIAGRPRGEGPPFANDPVLVRHEGRYRILA